MVTLVGTQTNFLKALKELLELEYEASEIYTAVINRLENKDYIKDLTKFKNDHLRHIVRLSKFITKLGEEAPKGPGGKQVLEIGAIAISKILGDKAILKALHMAENDTLTAYKRLMKHKGLTEDASPMIEAHLNDEEKHNKWVKSVIS